MRFYTCIFVIFSVLINSTGTTFIHLNYLIQKRKIVEQLCINKNKPELKCDGKCYLAKQLKKLEAEELKNASSKKHNPFTGKIELQSCTILQIEPSIFSSFRSEPKKHFYMYASLHSKEHLTAIFHPPTSRFS